MSAEPIVVARARSREGGACGWPGCRVPVRAGESIVKYDDGMRGGQTRFGNGLGRWCHAWHLGDPAA